MAAHHALSGQFPDLGGGSEGLPSKSDSAFRYTQLPMFMSGQEFMDHIKPGDAHGAGWASLRQKVVESKRGGIDNAWASARHGDETHYDSVKREGVRSPVSVYHPNYPDRQGSKSPRLRNGHHRVLASHDIDPERLIPVWHQDLDNTIGHPESH